MSSPHAADPAIPASVLADVAWPAITNPAGAAALTLQYQLEHSQWHDAATLQRLQFMQLEALLAHAWAQVPWHRARLEATGWQPGTPLSPAQFARLPLMTRADIQREGASLHARAVPKAHGRLLAGRTSGSTGQPMHFLGSQLDVLFWEAFTLRESLWHRRDFSLKLASIRPGVARATAAGWGHAFAVYGSGPHAELPIDTPLEEQVDWLLQEQPAYLLSTPNHLATLAEAFRTRGLVLPGLRALRTFGVTVEPRVRALCMQVFGVAVHDMYTTTECGYLALQCPDHPVYHVQSESALVEVLDDDGTPCGPGEIGRVVVTPLHHFAMPLLRYDLGDFAEVGAPCPCGRGLPVLARIVGRVRNRVTLPDGRRIWPALGTLGFFYDLPVRQWQIVQDRLDHLAVRLVVGRCLDAGEEARIRREVSAAFAAGLAIDLVYEDTIAPSASGKLEDFVSRLDG
jgi:phenylacetate-CoA ligase